VTIRKAGPGRLRVFADFENVPSWNRDQSPSILRAGRWGTIANHQPNRQEGFEVTVFEPTRRLAIDGEIGPFHARVDYRLEPIEGATRLINGVELEPSSAVSKLLAPFAGSRVKAGVAENLDTLKQILETDPRSPV
jgi:hypothetical protein